MLYMQSYLFSVIKIMCRLAAKKCNLRLVYASNFILPHPRLTPDGKLGAIA